MKTNMVLFGHGARDPRWAEPFVNLQRKIAQSLGADTRVDLAFLELMEPGLPEVAKQCVANGFERLVVIPVFFGQGGHLRKDFPVLIDQCKAENPNLLIEVTPPVGEWDFVLDSIAQGAVKTINVNK